MGGIRGKLQGAKLAANAQNAWRGNDVAGAISDFEKPVQAAKDFYTREKELAFKRLDLEASTFQDKQLANIAKATSIDEIPAFVRGFQEDLDTNFKKQKYGKEWLEEKGQIYFSLNNRDVERAKSNKEKELNSLNLESTLKTYADNISTAAPDKAAFLLQDAIAGVVETDNYLTPLEKKATKDNFIKMSLSGMIDTNPDAAIATLQNKNFGDLSDLERQSYIDKAKKMQEARIKDQIDLQNKQQRFLEKQANISVARLKVDYLTGNASRADVLKTAEQYKEVAPEKYSALLKDVLSDKGNKDAKLSEGEKFINLNNVYAQQASLLANPEATQEDYQNLFENISDSYRDGLLPKVEGQMFFDEFSKKYSDLLNKNLDSQGDWHAFSANEGYANLDKWMGKMFKKPSEGKTEAEKKIYRMETGRQAREKVRLQTLYKNNLSVVANKYGVKNVDDIPNSEYKSAIWSEALGATKQQYMTNQYPSANVAEINPTNILSARKGIVTVGNSSNEISKGKPLKDSRIVKVGKAKDGSYVAMFADGKIKKIDENQYNTFKGTK